MLSLVCLYGFGQYLIFSSNNVSLANIRLFGIQTKFYFFWKETILEMLILDDSSVNSSPCLGA